MTHNEDEEEILENIEDMMPEDFLDLLSATPPSELIAKYSRAELAVAAEGAAELFYSDEETDKKKYARLLDLTTRLAKSKEKTNGINLANSFYCLASYSYRQKEYEEAADLALKAVTTRLASGSEIAESSALHDYFLLVNALCWSKQFAEAEKQAGEWLALSNKLHKEGDTYNSEIHLLRARIFEELSRIADAEDEFVNAIELHEAAKSKNSADAKAAYNAFGEFLKRRGRDSEAEEFINRAKAIKVK
ncbi:MAG: hypothetical protein LCH63_16375 [Candidatus Melainabacteria bacterium]|jgi:tetratricopeptide (TPR) repeat protein|uniref:Tetratricopeptide repeat protein n=1 Tax=Candidatus Obscuribacter phosphatis TaxID=1906157 RepID=A0A8J7TL46_9BACT|nr:hypothetical protein [Candidatus Obscuribacter phosphatis]MCA0315394.1 hypothetical protein [Candidatus Melainabacteria bacterium]OPZ91676.1 MAG: hypothetical protein BWY75_00209 [bacterium ADurb.Bin425]